MRAYNARKSRRGTPKGLDPIDPNTCGAIKIGQVKAMAAALPLILAWTATALELLSGTVPVPHAHPEQVHVSVDRFMDSQIPLLAAWGVLSPPKKGEVLRCRCGLHSVMKPNGLGRVVFDARPANRTLPRSPGPFCLFGLDDLLGAWGNVQGKVSVVDFRHHFYQIPLARELRPYFAVMDSKGSAWLPNVVPMGWQDAPMIGQTLTWMCVLAREPEEDDLGIVPVLEGGDMPSYAAIRHPRKESTLGYIFVLLDGIAIISRSESVHTKWLKRVQRNAKRMGAVIKGITQGEFSGIEFGTEGWRTVEGLGTWPEPQTRRDWARCLGAVLWELRVRQVDLLAEEPLLDLFSRVGRAECDWDDAWSPGLEPARGLMHRWQALQERVWTMPKARGPGPERWIMLATDATPTSVSGVQLNPAGQVTKQWAEMALEPGEQVHREMEAIVLSAERWAAEARETNSGLIIATDAEICRQVWAKKHACSRRLRELLRRLYGLGLPLHIVRVDGASNAADGPSRGRDVDPAQARLTSAILNNARLTMMATPSGVQHVV